MLRRVMRRAIQQGRALELAPGFLTRYAERVRELMGATYPELTEHAESIDMWLSSEEEGFGRTLANGMELLRSEIDQCARGGREHGRRRHGLSPARHLRLSARADQRDARRRGAVDRGRLRRADGAPARSRARAGRRRRGAERRRPRRRACSASWRASARRRASPAMRPRSSTRRSRRCASTRSEAMAGRARGRRGERRALSGQARRVPLLCARRRPDRRRRHDRMRAGRLQRARRRRSARGR